MILGIPRGEFYYDYYGFISRLFDDSDIHIMTDVENDDEVLSKGSSIVVDEACLPIKLTAGQVEILTKHCDKVLVPRLGRDLKGRWLCPKLLGLPELLSKISDHEKIIVTGFVDFKNKNGARRLFWDICRKLGMDRKIFVRNFENAYTHQLKISDGNKKMHVEAGWEFTPELSEGEIILPNFGKVLLAGHGYNVYDKFSNKDIISKLDELGLETVTERELYYNEKEDAVQKLGLMKTPFWEAVVRILGTAVCLKDEVEGIIYLSSFSCGLDAFIIEMIKKYVGSLPVMVIKLDEHKGTAGFETRLEAFADMLQRRRAL